MLLQRTDRAKQSLLRELDINFQHYFHASLYEVINGLRLHYVDITTDPSPDELILVIDRTRILDFVPAPSILELRDTVHRVTTGTFGYCAGCKKPISTHVLESTPNAKLCPRCSQRVVRSGLT
jgi:hypothetical protein